MSLVIVGQGAWAAKLQVMIRSNTSLETFNIGARAFLEKKIEADAYWLATTPSNQLRILPSLPLDSTIILEKPAFLNSLELETVYLEYRRREGKLFFSLPWNFSSCLDDIANILSQGEITSIETHRGGPMLRSYIPSYMDWIPHDLGLLAALKQSFATSIEHVALVGESAQIKGNLGGASLFMNAGYLQERQATWKLTADSGEVFIIDFYSQVEDSGEEPLAKMLSCYLSGTYDSSRMFGVWREFFNPLNLR